MSLVELGIPYFPDPTTGRPVYNGYIYVGVPETDPTVSANQKNVTLRQEDGTEVSTAQPVRTGAGGVPLYNGSPVQIVVSGDYSVTVQNEQQTQLYYIPSAAAFEPLRFGLLVKENQTLTSGQTSVTFDNSLDFASFYIGGIDVDRGRLIEGEDYSVNLSTNTVTLTNSYPAGSILSAVYNEVGNGSQISPTTTTDLEDITSTINTIGKRTGRQVYNQTTSKPLWADGSADSDVWKDAQGATQHTPV